MDIEESSEGIFNSKPLQRIGGVDSYTPDDLYWRDLDQNKAMTLIELARKIGWRKAAQTLPSKSLVRHLTDPSGLRFMDFLSPRKGARILDLGAGWTALPFHTAKRYPTTKVYAMDMTLEGLVFLSVVREQEGLTNLQIAKAEVDRIPVANETMDIVLMTGALEWVDTVAPGPERVPSLSKVLLEAKRVMKEGGRFVMGVENRYSYRSLLGRSKHSSGRFRASTLSLRDCINLLAEAGYNDMRPFAAYPDYRLPQVITDVRNMREFWRNSRATGSRLLMQLPSRILEEIAPGYLIFARR